MAVTSRKGPSASATNFKIGTKKSGNDGNMWKIVTTANGVNRWQKVSSPSKTHKKKTKILGSSLKQLNQLQKKYNVSVYGSKEDIAKGLYRVRGFSMNNEDLEMIKPLLPTKQQKLIEKQVGKRQSTIISDYKGMWVSKPANLLTFTREEIIKHLRKFRDAWEKITGRNQDLSDDRLADEKLESLKKLLKWYYSPEAKIMAEDHLR